MKAMPRCPYTKGGAHDAMAIIPASSKQPLTLVCSRCFMSRQYRLTWRSGKGSLDNLTADQILRAVNKE